MAKHIETGRFGEEIALRLLEAKGYIILELNWRSGSREIDIIAQEGTTIVFVEVKTRRSQHYGTALQAIEYKKQAYMISAAHHYMRLKSLPYSARFDLVAIDYSSGEDYTVEHICNAFYPTDHLQRMGRNTRSYAKRIPKDIQTK